MCGTDSRFGIMFLFLLHTHINVAVQRLKAQCITTLENTCKCIKVPFKKTSLAMHVLQNLESKQSAGHVVLLWLQQLFGLKIKALTSRNLCLCIYTHSQGGKKAHKNFIFFSICSRVDGQFWPTHQSKINGQESIEICIFTATLVCFICYLCQ